MGIALFNSSMLLAPLHDLAQWLAGMTRVKNNLFRRQAKVISKSLRQPAAVSRLVADSSGCSTAVRNRPASNDNLMRPVRSLRVLRVVDSWHAPANAGRMVISGRMADVCAELERLADGETALHRQG